jgi:hypothetical protein
MERASGPGWVCTVLGSGGPIDGVVEFCGAPKRINVPAGKSVHAQIVCAIP